MQPVPIVCYFSQAFVLSVQRLFTVKTEKQASPKTQPPSFQISSLMHNLPLILLVSKHWAVQRDYNSQ